MAKREIEIPFGPDRTGTFDPIGDTSLEEGAVPGSAAATASQAGDARQPFDMQQSPDGQLSARQSAVVANRRSLDLDLPVVISPAMEPGLPDSKSADTTASTTSPSEDDSHSAPAAQAAADADEGTYGDMDEIQSSFAALKDSIGQGRELKAREKEREELAQALSADHEELADRDNILENYHAIIAEQDAIIADRTMQRDARKGELARVSSEIEQVQARLESLREEHSFQLQPLETELGRIKAFAEQAKNDERSRKSELNAAESELRRAGDSDASTMAVAKHQQVQAAYSEAHARAEQAKEQLDQVQKTYDDAKQQAGQAEAPLERTLEDLNRQTEVLKGAVNRLGDEILVARKRRQYCDNVYQYPDETAKMHSEVAHAEEVARRMDEQNDALRDQLNQSKQQAKKAKVAIGVVIAIIIVIIVAFIAVSGR